MVCLRLLPRLTHKPLVSLGGCACLLAGLLLTSCSSARTGISPTPSPATTARTVISQATPGATTGPVPTMTPLAPPPQNCALRPPPEVRHLDHLRMHSDVHLIGGGPFWIFGFYYQNVLHLAQPRSQPWPVTKMVVEVGPNYDQPVTLRLRQMRTGALAW